MKICCVRDGNAEEDILLSTVILLSGHSDLKKKQYEINVEKGFTKVSWRKSCVLRFPSNGKVSTFLILLSCCFPQTYFFLAWKKNSGLKQKEIMPYRSKVQLSRILQLHVAFPRHHNLCIASLFTCQLSNMSFFKLREVFLLANDRM